MTSAELERAVLAFVNDKLLAGRARVTPMVFGVQRVVAAVWLHDGAKAARDCRAEAEQLDAFGAV